MEELAVIAAHKAHGGDVPPAKAATRETLSPLPPAVFTTSCTRLTL